MGGRRARNPRCFSPLPEDLRGQPHFFIPIITLSTNTSENALQYKAELALVKAQKIDITYVEDQLNKFNVGFSRNYTLASDQLAKAIDPIDNSIVAMKKVK